MNAANAAFHAVNGMLRTTARRPLMPVADIMAKFDVILDRFTSFKGKLDLIQSNIDVQEELMRSPVERLPRDFDPIHCQQLAEAYRRRRAALMTGERIWVGREALNRSMELSALLSASRPVAAFSRDTGELSVDAEVLVPARLLLDLNRAVQTVLRLERGIVE